MSEGWIPPCFQEFFGRSFKSFASAFCVAPRTSDMMQKVRLGILMKSILSLGDKSVHFAIRYIAVEIPKTQVREARHCDFSMGFRFSNSIPTARRIRGEKSREYWIRTAGIATPNISVWLYSLAEKWMNVIYSFLFSTIGPQSFSTPLYSARA